MNQTKPSVAKYTNSFFENTEPVKMTEGRKLKLNTEVWGLLSEYYLESVKINRQKEGGTNSLATLKIGDRSGHITCLVRGPTIGLLFDLTPAEWLEVEKLNNWGEQLFYRYFKNGLKSTFNYEQKLFYNFCLSNQKKDILVAVYRRCLNMRNVDRNEAVLEIIELRKCDSSLMDLYTENVKNRALTV